jgi:hypothetical protein
MSMIWFIPLAILIGLAGTQTTLRSRHNLKSRKKERAWWLLLVLSWVPLVCWFVSQFISQD